MRLQAPELSRECLPAQFVQVQTDSGLSPYLRRPFSILRTDIEAGWIEIVYDVIGPGTKRMAKALAGDCFDLVGPLGNSFFPPESDRLLLVAGGVGVVPLGFLMWRYPELYDHTVFLMGAAGKDRMPNMTRMMPEGVEILLATDDGSLGYKGFVTDLIGDQVIPGRTAIVTCGPHAMMSRVAQIASEDDIPCFASLENHMACGFGACVGCVVEFQEWEREDEQYRRVCIEGPVMDASQIAWS